MKKAILIICMLLVLIVTVFGVEQIKITVNGKPVDFQDVMPYINEDGRTLVPIRFITEEIGAISGWSPETKKATFKKDGKNIVLKIGEKEVEVDGENVEFDTKPVLKEGRIFVPLRFISEFFGAGVTWNPKTNTVEITVPMQEVRPEVQPPTKPVPEVKPSPSEDRPPCIWR